MMENVPVKIAERYKPPPQIRQHSVQLNSNKFQLNYYHESPEFQYDFQLERKVLTTLPEWRRMRQMNKEARLERQEKRRIQRIRENEERQKKLLGEVKYPSAEELSTSSYESNLESSLENTPKQPSENQNEEKKDNTAEGELSAHASNNFNNILQPTIVGFGSMSESKQAIEDVLSAIIRNQQKPLENNAVNLRRNTSFNYKDFEEDTSSPFDNIELKTINDLDILAQVLHNTQVISKDFVKEISSNADESASRRSSMEATLEAEESKDQEKNSNDIVHVEVVEPQSVLEKVNFNHLEHLLENANEIENQNIPNGEVELSSLKSTRNSSNISDYEATANLSIPFINNASNCYTYNSNIVYNMQANENFVITPNSNGYVSPESFINTKNLYSPQQQSFNHQITIGNVAAHSLSPLERVQRMESCDHKSKSVPDLLKELSQEVTNSANRRTRNYSQNMDSKNNLLEEEPAIQERKTSSDIFELSNPTSKIVKSICAMGFPAERVKNVAKRVGEDDKKILEHLISLTDLLDLGFEEEKISDALVKFDNNKEKALEYLIT